MVRDFHLHVPFVLNSFHEDRSKLSQTSKIDIGVLFVKVMVF